MTKQDILIAFKEGEIDIKEAVLRLNENEGKSEKQEKNIYQAMIYKNVLTPLSTVAHHHDVECIERFFSEQFPAHLAIHRVNSAKEQKRSYTELHTHDEQEINIILCDKDDELVFEIQIEDEIYYVNSNTSIWIPSGIKHSSNVVKGSGYYIAIRLSNDPVMFEQFVQKFNMQNP